MIERPGNLETTIETHRLLLEPLRRSHAAELFEILSDPLLYRFIPQDPPVTLEALADRYERLETRASPSGEEAWLNWTARLKADSICLGRIEATVRQGRSALLAYQIGASYWGRGFAAEACRRVIRALFEDWAVEQIMAEVDTRNTASIRLLERLGFGRGALRIGADVFKGSSSDEFTYTLERPRPSG